MTKIGRHNPYSAWLISVQPDICKCLLFPLFVAFCDYVYCFSYVSLLPLFHRVCRLSLHSPSTHLTNPLTLPLCNAPTGVKGQTLAKRVRLLGKSTGSYGEPKMSRCR